MSGYHFLVHKSFEERRLEFITQHPDHSDSLQTQLRKSFADPASQSQFDDMPPHLQGKLYKLWVSGGGGFRYIYLFEPGKSVVLPIYLSLKPKGQFQYDDAEIAGIAEEILDDFVNGRMENFFEPRQI